MSNSHEEYEGIFNLLANDEEAQDYFSALPEYVQQAISARSADINTVDDLEIYAGHLLADYD